MDGTDARASIRVVIITTEAIHGQMHQYRQALAMDGVRVTTSARAGAPSTILGDLLAQHQPWVVYVVIREDLDEVAIGELRSLFARAGQTDQRFCASVWNEEEPTAALGSLRSAIASLREEVDRRFPRDAMAEVEAAMAPSPAPRQPQRDGSMVAPAAIAGVMVVGLAGLGVAMWLNSRPGPAASAEAPAGSAGTDTGAEEADDHAELDTVELVAGGEPTEPAPPIALEAVVEAPDRAPTPEELERAREAGVIVELEGLITSVATPSLLDWDAAARHCEELTLASVGGWKLPTEEQARAMMKAKKHGEASIWLTAPDDAAGKRAPLFDLRARRSKVSIRKQRAAQAVCVRFYVPPASGDESSIVVDDE